MSKIRVYQLAKELNVDNKVLISKLSDLGISTNSHMSTLEEEEAALVMELIKEEAKAKEKESTKQVATEPAPKSSKEKESPRSAEKKTGSRASSKPDKKGGKEQNSNRKPQPEKKVEPQKAKIH